LITNTTRRPPAARRFAPVGGARRWSELLTWSTVALAWSVAVAPVAGPLPVAATASVWVATAVASLVPAVRRALHGRGTSGGGAYRLAAAATALAALRLAALGLHQLIGGRSALSWNVDWRYHATQAYGIARFGNLDDSLDYAGTPVEYHAAPSWIAGALQRVLGVPVDCLLYIVVPLVAVVVIARYAWRVLRALGVGRKAAWSAVAVVTSLTTAPLQILEAAARGRLVDRLLDADTWLFAPGIMLNSLLALAVGFVAIWIVITAQTRGHMLLGVVTLATLVAIKPQYLVGFSAALGIGFVVDRRRTEGSWSSAALALVVGSGTAAVCSALTAQSTSFTGITLDVLADGRSAAVRRNDLLIAAVAMLAILAALPVARRAVSTRTRSYALGAVAGVGALAVFLYTTSFLLDGSAVARARAVGLDYTRTSYQWDVQQSLVPAALVLAMLAAAGAIAVATRRSPVGRRVATLAVVTMLALPMPFTVAALAAPTGRAGYEWTEERGLRALFAMVDVEAGRWLANDLADPTEDFSRPLRAVNLTSFGTAQFAVSNVAYSGWTQDDVVRRLRAVRRFFDTEWSPAHDAFLRRFGVRYVLVRDRCPPAWNVSDVPGRVVGRRGPWTLFDTDAARPANATTVRPWPAPGERPRYGRAACLTGELDQRSEVSR
jgi:hypothetical protein